jgi:hypothetical protein
MEPHALTPQCFEIQLREGHAPMRCIYVDRIDDERVSVRIAAGISKTRTKIFNRRDDAIRFAESHMGRGVVIDTTLMSPEQRAAHKEREARTKALITEMDQAEKR